MKASNVIENLQKLIDEHGDLHVLEEEELEYSAGNFKYNEELDVFVNEVHFLGLKEEYPLATCGDCCELMNKTKLIYRYNGYDHVICPKCFFSDFEYELYTEQAYTIDNEGTKTFIIEDSKTTYAFAQQKARWCPL